MRKLCLGIVSIVTIAAALFSFQVFADTADDSVYYGDVDLDGRVTVLDVTYVQKERAGLVVFTDDQVKRANVDGNDILNIMDASCIQKYLAKLITDFPVKLLPTEAPTVEPTQEPTMHQGIIPGTGGDKDKGSYFPIP